MQMLYDPQKDNVIWENFKIIWTGILKNKFVVYGQNWNREAVLATKDF